MKVKIVTRTIILNIPNSDVTYPKTIQEVKFVNINGAWKTKKSEWDEYSPPKIEGKKPDIEVLPSIKVTPDSQNQIVRINYQDVVKHSESLKNKSKLVKKDNSQNIAKKKKTLSFFNNKKMYSVSSSKEFNFINELKVVGKITLNGRDWNTWFYEK